MSVLICWSESEFHSNKMMTLMTAFTYKLNHLKKNAITKICKWRRPVIGC